MSSPSIDRELKKGSAELLILSLVEARARHGYEISKLIASRSEGALTFRVASLYPLLYRLEGRGWIKGRWVEKTGERRRRFYRITAEGRQGPGHPAAKLGRVCESHRSHRRNQICLIGKRSSMNDWRPLT